MSDYPIWDRRGLSRPVHPLLISVGDATPPDVREEAYRWNAALILPIKGGGNDHHLGRLSVENPTGHIGRAPR